MKHIINGADGEKPTRNDELSAKTTVKATTKSYSGFKTPPDGRFHTVVPPLAPPVKGNRLASIGGGNEETESLQLSTKVAGAMNALCEP